LQKLLQHGADPFARSATTNYQRNLTLLFGYSSSGVQPGAPSDTTDSPNARRSPVEKAIQKVDGMLGDILLTNNPSPARRTPSGKNALDLALRPFRSGIVDFLLAHGFSANQTNADGLTPLQEMAGLSPNNSFIPARKPPPYFVHYGEKLDHDEAIVADFLLSRGATVDVFSAAGMGLTNQLAALLRSNPRLANARDSFGRPPLHYAASGQSNTTALLLKAGADPAARTTRPIDPTPDAGLFDRRPTLSAESSPLHFACLRDNQVTAQLLVKAGAPLDQPDADGNTPLHIAAAHRSNNTNLTKLLISAGAPLDLTNRAGQTPLRLAIKSEWTGDAELLLKAGARKDIGLENTTLLHIAAAQSRAAHVSVLLAAGLAVDARDGQGRTPLQCAVTKLNLTAMELLLTKGADINAMDLNGDTALHQICLQRVDSIYITQGDEARQALAAKREPPRLHLTGWLLDHGANPNLTNHKGRTPLELLRTYKWDSPWEKSEAAARVALLLKAGAKDE
jgi:ankyrin repeat protein